jgi:hypothetical protein
LITSFFLISDVFKNFFYISKKVTVGKKTTKQLSAGGVFARQIGPKGAGRRRAQQQAAAGGAATAR